MEVLIKIFPFLFYVLLILLNTYRVRRLICLSNFIILLFSLSMFCFGVSCLLHNGYYYNLEGFLLITLPILVCVWPLTEFERRLSFGVKFYPVCHVRNVLFSYFLILIGLYAVVFFGRNLLHVFSLDISTFRYAVAEGDGVYKSSIFSKVAVFGAYLSPISLFMYFYHISIGTHRKVAYLLLLSSSSFVLYTLNVAGRDGLVLWVLSYLSLFCLFSPLMNRKVKRRQVCSFFGVFIIIVPFFLYITFQRFGGGTGDISGVFSSFVDYLGQQLYQLSLLCDKLSVSRYAGEPRLLIPFLCDLSSILSGAASVAADRYALRAASMAAGLDTFRFSFFVGGIFTEFGSIGVFVYVVLTYTIFRRNLKLKQRFIYLPRLIIAFTWYLIIIVGVFYFYYGQLVGNVFLLFPFVLYVYYNVRICRSGYLLEAEK